MASNWNVSITVWSADMSGSSRKAWKVAQSKALCTVSTYVLCLPAWLKGHCITWDYEFSSSMYEKCCPEDELLSCRGTDMSNVCTLNSILNTHQTLDTLCVPYMKTLVFNRITISVFWNAMLHSLVTSISPNILSPSFSLKLDTVCCSPVQWLNALISLICLLKIIHISLFIARQKSYHLTLECNQSSLGVHSVQMIWTKHYEKRFVRANIYSKISAFSNTRIPQTSQWQSHILLLTIKELSSFQHG